MKTYDLISWEDDVVLVTFTASEIDAQLILDQFAHSSNYEEEFELIEVERAQRGE